MLPFPKMNWKTKNQTNTLLAWVAERKLSGHQACTPSSSYFALLFFPLKGQFLLQLQNKTKVNILLKSSTNDSDTKLRQRNNCQAIIQNKIGNFSVWHGRSVVSSILKAEANLSFIGTQSETPNYTTTKSHLLNIYVRYIMCMYI